MLGNMADKIPKSFRKCVSTGKPALSHEEWKNLTGIEILDGIGSTEMLHIFISSREDALKPGPDFCSRYKQWWSTNVMIRSHGTTGQLAVKPTGCTYLDDPRQRNTSQRMEPDRRCLPDG